MASDDSRVSRAGELTEAAGRTVRALHHCDQLGLLHPSLPTSGGYRLYGGTFPTPD